MSANDRELTGIPLYDAALALIDLAARTTVHEINSLSDKGLALSISAMIYKNIDPEVQLMDIRTQVLENKQRLVSEFVEQKESSMRMLEVDHHCPHCGHILSDEVAT